MIVFSYRIYIPQVFSIEINLIDPTKEEIEQKNKELEDINQDTSTLDNENTNIDIVVETKTYEDNESVHTESYEATKLLVQMISIQ